jgi:flagellar biosynthesis protein FlhG
MNPTQPVLTAIASGKGGTGKTFIASTLAQALANEGERVLLFDGDLGLSNVAVQLGLAHADSFSSVLAGTLAVHDAATPFCRRANKLGKVDVLAGPSGGGGPAAVDAATVMRTVAALRLSIGYDRVVLDLGAGVEDTVMRFATAADECFVVQTPDPAALTDAYAFIKLYIRRAGGRIPGFLVNQAANAREAGEAAAALTTFCENFLNIAPAGAGFVRHDAKVRDAVRRQTPLLKLHPGCAAADDIIAVAREVRGAERNRAARAAGTR